MCIMCLRNDLRMCHAILDSTFRNKTASQLRPFASVPGVVVFVRSTVCGGYSSCLYITRPPAVEPVPSCLFCKGTLFDQIV